MRLAKDLHCSKVAGEVDHLLLQPRKEVPACFLREQLNPAQVQAFPFQIMPLTKKKIVTGLLYIFFKGQCRKNFTPQTGDKRQEAWDRRQGTGAWDMRWDQRRETEGMRQELWDWKLETGDGRRETGGMRQMWDQRNETVDVRHQTGDVRQQTWYLRQEMVLWHHIQLI